MGPFDGEADFDGKNIIELTSSRFGVNDQLADIGPDQKFRDVLSPELLKEIVERAKKKHGIILSDNDLAKQETFEDLELLIKQKKGRV